MKSALADRLKYVPQTQKSLERRRVSLPRRRARPLARTVQPTMQARGVPLGSARGGLGSSRIT